LPAGETACDFGHPFFVSGPGGTLRSISARHSENPMSIRIGIVMDPISAIHYKKDSSLAMLLAARQRGWELSYMEPQDIYLQNGQAMGSMRPLQVFADPQRWYELGEAQLLPLIQLDGLLMRTVPPYANDLLSATQTLEAAERDDVLVAKRPASLRDCNESLSTTRFPQCCPQNTVTRPADLLRALIAEH